jgi:hypothetical protein
MTAYGLPDPDASSEAFNGLGKLYANGDRILRQTPKN